MTNAASIAAGLTICALLVGSAFGAYKIQTHIESAEITFVSKERLLQVSTDKDGRSSSGYRNFAYSDSETYVVADSLWNGHFAAATVYAQIREGVPCRVTLSGYRFGLLSMFQNIIAVDCAVGAEVPNS